jgi:hypothetical protein
MNIRAFPVLDPAYGVPFAGARDCPLAAGSQRRPPPAIGRAYPDNLSVAAASITRSSLVTGGKPTGRSQHPPALTATRTPTEP